MNKDSKNFLHQLLAGIEVVSHLLSNNYAITDLENELNKNL